MRIGLSLANAGRAVMWRALNEGVITIGSNSECDLSVPADDVAPVQALLRREGDALTLVNRDPRGTRVGSELVEQELRLGDADAISIGPITATVHFEPEEVAGGERGRTRTLTRTRARGGRAYLCAPEVRPGELFEIDERGLSIGSDPSNDIVVNDPYVSAFHARAVLEEGRVIVRDLNSRNGVFVGDHKVREGEAPAGVQVRLGRSLFVIADGASEVGAAGGSAASETRPLIGQSARMQSVRERIQRLAAASAPLLITGETGTGKELAARLTAALSPRASKPFLAINCGALGRSLIESELFGHEKGAFTGAVGRKLGAFEAAHGGTLFLDEIGELPVELQPQLLRVLETGEVRRVGAVETFQVDVRLLAATNRRLDQEVAAGTFREDLYHRLHVLVLEMPSLRERPEDIPELAQHFVTDLSPAGEKLSISDDAMRKLVGHAWPGNARELRNTLQRAVLMRNSNVIDPDDITFAASTLRSRVQTASATRQRTLHELEREAILVELVRHQGNKTEAAAALGLSRSTIHRKIEEYGLDVEVLVSKK
jgi:DNA-binding NtrC family response regulator/pSer/pThr/pTyr-binding forkhead associated (FHA) protein